MTTVPGTGDSSRKNEKVLVHSQEETLSPPPGSPLCCRERSLLTPKRPALLDLSSGTCLLRKQPAENGMGTARSDDLSHLPLLVLGCSLGHALTLAGVAEQLGMQSLEPGGFRAQHLYLGIVSLLGPCPPGSSFL